MVFSNAPRLIAAIALALLVLSVSWKTTASRLFTAQPYGIRLLAPFIPDCSDPCGSEEKGCKNLFLRICNVSAVCQMSGPALVSVSGGTTPYAFSATDPNGMPIAVSAPTDNGHAVTFMPTTPGRYTVMVTDAKGCRVTCSYQSRLLVNLQAPPCQPTGIFTAAVEGGTAPYSFVVKNPDGNLVPTSPPGSDGPVAVVATFTGTKIGTYTVTVTDATGCQGTASSAVVPCSSLTQSEWGRNKPKFNGRKRIKTLTGLFRDSFVDERARHQLIVGVSGAGLRSVSFFDDATGCIIDRLPASGSPGPLPIGLGDSRVNPDTCQTSPQLPLQGDEFQNELLGQTIALTLNAGGTFAAGGLSPDFFGSDVFLNPPLGLWSLALCNTMITQAALPGNDGILGTQDDLLDPGPDGALGTEDDPKLSVTVPTSVLNAIAAGSTLELLGKFTVQGGNFTVTVPARTVGRLLMLANFALAGDTNLGAASFVDINAAVDAVNRAFDNCRFLVDCPCRGCANLQIDFSPDPVPQSALSCSGGRPAWSFTATITETAGSGITISRFTWDFYNGGGLLNTQTNFTNDFITFFNQCGLGSARIAAHGHACASLCTQLGGLLGGSVVMTFYGTDDNGNQLAFASRRLSLLDH